MLCQIKLCGCAWWGAAALYLQCIVELWVNFCVHHSFSFRFSFLVLDLGLLSFFDGPDHCSVAYLSFQPVKASSGGYRKVKDSFDWEFMLVYIVQLDFHFRDAGDYAHFMVYRLEGNQHILSFEFMLLAQGFGNKQPQVIGVQEMTLWFDVFLDQHSFQIKMLSKFSIRSLWLEISGKI